MPEQLKELLDKIKNEGIKAAEDKASQIESEAKAKAGRIISDAKRNAQEITNKAKQGAKKLQENGEASLKQAARDLMLAVKDDIRKLFDKIIASEVTKALSGEELSEILSEVIEKYIDKKAQVSDIAVLLKQEDLKKLKNTFIAKLKDKFKDKIDFKPSGEIKAGFSISFDKGKSSYEFTNEALAEALSVYLNEELAKLLNEAVS